MREANKKVLIQLGKKRPSSHYHYDPELRAKIGKFAATSGNKAAVAKFSKELGRPVSESTIRGMKKVYYWALKQRKDGEPVTRLEHRSRGRPLLLGSFDTNVQEYIRKLRRAGGIVNRAIIIAAATGIVQHNNPAMLRAQGGSIELGKKWADSILLRMGLVERKATKSAKKVPPDFADIKQAFLQRVTENVRENKVPPELVINWDQTGTKFVPTSQWTLAEQGAKQVDVTGLDDKRDMTALLACTLSGSLLPPQLIYAGKTTKCHPVVDFPAGWDIWHSDSHWSTEKTMLQYVGAVIVPYVEATREALGLQPDHCAVAIFDVFTAHRCDSVLEALNKHHIKYTFVPASCTGDLQPHDLTFNAAFKRELRECFTRWYATIVKNYLDQGKELSTIRPDLRTSIFKPIHAHWLIEVHSSLSKKKDLIIQGFEKAGIKDFITTAWIVSVNVIVSLRCSIYL